MINSAIPDHEKDKGFVEEVDKPLGKGKGGETDRKYQNREYGRHESLYHFHWEET